MHKFYSNGKLLLSGEYLILDGATGLALPTLFGQELSVKKTDKESTLSWTSIDEKGNVWFEAQYSLPELKVLNYNEDLNVAETLQKILLQAKRTNTAFLNDTNGIDVTTKLSFPRNWGLGTSSTLINNIAQWAEVDAFNLLFNSFGGSGYDIACAQRDQAITYQLKNGIPSIETVVFDPSFKDQLYFVHLNKKQISSERIKAYKSNETDQKAVQRITEISKSLLRANTLSDFNTLLKEHESILSSILREQSIQQRLFSDFNGQIKSLGAWGGDFILATGDHTTSDYFSLKGYQTVIPYASMIKTI